MTRRNETPAFISVRLTWKEKSDFTRKVLRKDRTVSQILRDMIRDYIRKH